MNYFLTSPPYPLNNVIDYMSVSVASAACFYRPQEAKKICYAGF